MALDAAVDPNVLSYLVPIIIEGAGCGCQARRSQPLDIGRGEVRPSGSGEAESIPQGSGKAESCF